MSKGRKNAKGEKPAGDRVEVAAQPAEDQAAAAGPEEPAGASDARKRGRPEKLTAELKAEVCTRIVMGESIREICLSEHMPCEATVWLAMAKDKEFSENYREAKNVQMDRMAEQLTDIADDGTNDWVEREIARGKVITVVDRECVERSKLRVHTRQWLMSKFLPKKFGDAVTLKGDKDNPIETVTRAIVVPKKDAIGSSAKTGTHAGNRTRVGTDPSAS